MKKIFLLPYAGGSAMTYEKWHAEGIDMIPIEYSGHSFRFKEPLASTLSELTDDVILQMKINGLDSEYEIFGHSMGGLVVWLVAHRIVEIGLKRPRRIIISAMEPPREVDFHQYLDYIDDANLINFMAHYNRLSSNRMYSKSFQKNMLPIIKNDYRILSEFRYKERAKLDIPMLIISSPSDTMMRHNVMSKWLNYSNKVTFCEMMGDHFYVDNNPEKVVDIICS